jgi:hypothetical protein
MLDRHEFMVVRTMVELLQICVSVRIHSLWIKKKRRTYVEHTCPSVCDLVSAPKLFVTFLWNVV